MKASEYSKLTKEQRASVPFRDKPAINKVFAGVIIVAIVGLIIMFVSQKSSVGKKYESADIANYAKAYCEPAVEQLLNAPASAKFQGEKEVLLSSDSTAIVRGYVDAQNSFGALLRSHYEVKMKYLGDISDPGQWIVLESRLDQ